MIKQADYLKLSQEWDVVLPPYEVIPVAGLRSQSEVYNWGHTFLKAKEVYNTTRGDGVLIAILDTAGTFQTHPDLQANSLEPLARNFTNTDTAEDIHGHGTHCAGIAAAANNGFGVIGMAPKAKLVPVKVLNDQGAGSYGWIAQGIRYIADLSITGVKAKVISLSLGGSSGSSVLESAVLYAISKGCIVVAAAGNSYRGESQNTMNFPARYEPVIAVGSIGENAQPSSFSSAGTEIDIVAPGERIYSTHKNQSYAYLSGTSMATPFISGMAALLAGHRSDLNNQASMHQHLTSNAQDLYRTGFDNRTGHGIPFVPTLFGAPVEPPNETTPPPPPAVPPTTPEPPAPPVDPVKKARTLNFSFNGPYEVAWEIENNASSASPSLSFNTNEVDPQDLPLETAQARTLKVTQIDFSVESTTLAEIDYDRALAHFEWFFSSRGFVLEANSDLYDALKWTRHFLVLLLDRRKNFKIEVQQIAGEDEVGRYLSLQD